MYAREGSHKSIVPRIIPVKGVHGGAVWWFNRNQPRNGTDRITGNSDRPIKPDGRRDRACDVIGQGEVPQVIDDLCSQTYAVHKAPTRYKKLLHQREQQIPQRHGRGI